MTTTDNSFTPRKVNYGWISESFELFRRDSWTWVFLLRCLAVKKDRLSVIVFYFVLGLIFAASFLCAFGELVTLPMTLICRSLAYRDMVGMPRVGSGAPAFVAAPAASWPPQPSLLPEQIYRPSRNIKTL